MPWLSLRYRKVFMTMPSDCQLRDSMTGVRVSAKSLARLRPEDRLRSTESYVFTYLGDAAEADAAQDRAICHRHDQRIPSNYRRGPAQIELQRALVNSGDVTSGVEHASAALQSVPGKDQIRPIVALAKEVLGAVPAPQSKKVAVVEFRDCLALTSAAG
jgi:hypothetical protein